MSRKTKVQKPPDTGRPARTTIREDVENLRQFRAGLPIPPVDERDRPASWWSIGGPR